MVGSVFPSRNNANIDYIYRLITIYREHHVERIITQNNPDRRQR